MPFGKVIVFLDEKLELFFLKDIDISMRNIQRILRRRFNCWAHQTEFKIVLFYILIILFSINSSIAFSQTGAPYLQYVISITQPENHTYHLELHISGWKQDTACLKMPNWMPGYYQMMDYAKDLENMLAKDKKGNQLPVERINDNTWTIRGLKDKSFVVTYTIRTNRQFVANSYVDKDHAYLVPGNTFLFVDGFLEAPVSVKLKINPEWKKIATGLEPVFGKSDEFIASDFDILYDCPILIGNLEELPSFKVKGIEHRFIGYKLGDDEETLFSFFGEQLTTLENDPGRLYQSLSQASYNTWEEGPFGTSGTGPDNSISVYNKGVIIGMLLDFEIRNATRNNKSLDDVMRRLYRHYYKEEKRGFTDAEFQQACEQVAGISLTSLFEYVYTTKEVDYAKYLSQAGLRIDKHFSDSNEKTQRLAINRLTRPDPLQSAILSSWLGE